jgi:hypothetical protein
MNILELGGFLGIFAGTITAYYAVSPRSELFDVPATITGTIAGCFAGRFTGLLFLLPGTAKLVRFITTGRRGNPSLTLK